MPGLGKVARVDADPKKACETCIYKCVKQASHTAGEVVPQFLDAESSVDVALVLDFPRKEDSSTSPLLDPDPENPTWVMLRLMLKRVFDNPAKFLKVEDKRPLTWAVTFATRCKPAYYSPKGVVGDKDSKGNVIKGGAKNAHAKAVKSCAPFTREFINKVKPKVVICFNKDGLTSLGITCPNAREARGKIFKIPNVTYDNGYSPWAILTYSPALLCRPKEVSAFSVWERDFIKAREIAINGFAKVPVVEMIKEYVFPKTVEEISDICNKLKSQPWLTSDIEASGLTPFRDDAKFKVMALGWGKGLSTAFFIDHPSVSYKPKDAFKPVLDLFRSGIPISGHNYKYDTVYMSGLGYLEPSDIHLLWDTLLVEYWLDENRARDNDQSKTTSLGFGELGLKTLVWDYFPQYGGYDEAANMKKHFKEGTEPSPQEFLEYGAMDTDVQWQLTKHQMDRIASLSMRERAAFHNCFYGTLLPATKTSIDAELFGVAPNLQLINSLKPRVAMELFRLRSEIELAGKKALNTERFSITSDKDMKLWLFGPKKLGGLSLKPLKLTPTKAPSLDKEAVSLILENYGDRVPELNNYAKWAKLDKLSTTYLNQPLAFTGNDGRIHCQTVLHGARTGRISIQDPPLQTLSKDLGALPVTTKEESLRISKLYEAGKFDDPYSNLEEINVQKYKSNFLTYREAGLSCKEKDIDKLAVTKVVPKSLYCAPEGYDIVGSDLSQIEVVVAACKSFEYKMLAAIDRGLDMHCTVGSKIYKYDYEDFVYWTKGAGSEIDDSDLSSAELEKRNKLDRDRGSCKEVSFGVLYGMSPYTLKDRLPYTPEEEAMEDIKLDPNDFFALQPKDQSKLARAEKIFDGFLGEFTKINEYISDCHNAAMKEFQVISEFGRIRRFPILEYILSVPNWKRNKLFRRIVSACKRQAANAPIQGLASDMCLKSETKIHSELKKIGGSALFPVHDNILAAVPKGNKVESYKIFKHSMLAWPRWKYPDLVKCRLKSDFEICENTPSVWGTMQRFTPD